ncbi:nicotinate (nicotinamide) nucleotide adenylyltransferase [Halarcobacter ebronensis]|uniref:Probable nicotinate-nucleotide adenylyltransferase n=1 Tax=Halarcobacter ebronensis TaxID=1462615 RepID=A0A4Q1B0V2_9BACT|nr:nicotinate (nicotinamide) nucleotide adenylyltransferase [Halarcobacter ebronensis]QKF80873.1 nicotinate-mononucleotide adenylyltransferase [Halarcobacter ebronensis]RXK08663.1 nicotinate (nicotinamide) nucleotide adenylyltransferase [Halarcobacter ebronensis]
MHIAIFGGSFDPPHIGHQTIVKKALKKLDIDLLIVVPAYLNPLKVKSFLDAKVRYKLLKKLFAKKERVVVSSYEIDMGRPVYSIETIKQIIEQYKPEKLYLIIGADNYKSFHLWESYEEIEKLVTLVVVTRDGIKHSKNSDVKRLKVDIKISSTQLRNTFNLDYIPKKIRRNVEKIWHKKGKV